MAVGISNFPTSLDAASDLVEATNNAFTTINMVGGLSSGATTITVVSTASFPNTGIFRINNEVISYSAKTATTFTVQTRGFESTTAASHANGDQVSLDITASSNNAKNSAIIALETKIGTGSSTPTANTVLRGTGTGTSGFGQVALTTDVTGTLPVANGGTGVTTSTGTGSVVLSNSPTMVSPTLGQATYTRLTHSTAGGIRIGESSPDVIDTGGGGIVINPGPSSASVQIGGQIIAEVPDHSTFGVPARIELGYKAPTSGRDRLRITTTGTGSNPTARTMTVQPAANLAANCTVTIPDGTDTLVTRNGTATLTNKTIDVLSNTITGTFSPSNGGTGLNSIPANNVILGNGVFTVQTVAPGMSGNVLTSDGTTWTSAAPTGGMSGMTFKNALINGDFCVAQRGTSYTSTTIPFNNNDLAYHLDRWYLLSDGNNVVNVTQSTDAPSNRQFSCALTVTSAGASKKFGIAQIVERLNMNALIGSTVSVSFKARVSNATRLNDLRVGVVAWNGTADGMTITTKDLVSAWGTSAQNPTQPANWTLQNTPAAITPTTSWATYKVENVTVSSTISGSPVVNLAVFIWSNSTTATAGDILYLTEVQLETGSMASDFEHLPHDVVLRACERYLAGFNYNGGGLNLDQFFGGQTTRTTNSHYHYLWIAFRTQTRVVPTGLQKASPAYGLYVLESRTDFTVPASDLGIVTQSINSALLAIFTNLTTVGSDGSVVFFSIRAGAGFWFSGSELGG